MNPAAVGALVRDRRRASGASLADVAADVGVAKLRLDLFERGLSPLPRADRVRLGEHLGLDAPAVGALLELPDPPVTVDPGRPGTCVVRTRRRQKAWEYYVLVNGQGPAMFLEPARDPAWLRDVEADPRVELTTAEGRFVGRARRARPEEVDGIRDLFRRKYAGAAGVLEGLLRAGNVVVVEEVCVESAWNRTD